MIEIKDKSMCSGCYACINICSKQCIKMNIDNEGFWYPKIDSDKCIDCYMCERVCPIINKLKSSNEPKAYACYNKDEYIRLNSSSGGLFTLLAAHTINNCGVVYGAVFNEEFEVVHSRIDNIEDLRLLRGAKYTQSCMGYTYKRVKRDLELGIEVYFSGTPCQIDGLISFLGKNYDNLVCQDIICHGVPSPRVWKNYLKSFGNNIKRVQFRNKDYGWTKYRIHIISDDKNYMKNHKKDTYMKSFISNICLRPSCYNCHSKSLNRNSDITLADFWGIDNVDSSMNDDKGTSLVFVNSNKGQVLFNNIIDQIIYKQVDVNEAIKYNPSAYQSVTLTQKRTDFFNMYSGNNLEYVVNVLTKISFFKKIKILIRKIKNKLLKISNK